MPPGSPSGSPRCATPARCYCSAPAVWTGIQVLPIGPGIVGSPGARQTLLRDPHFAEVVSFYDRLSMVLVGVGSLDTPSRLLHDSGNVIGAEDEQELRARGAVGDICQRFFDENGRLVQSSLDGRVIGISFDQLKRTPRTVAVAGGGRKLAAIRAVLRGRWVDTLITDLGVAERLLQEP